jgi:hypothetical protein
MVFSPKSARASESDALPLTATLARAAFFVEMGIEAL